MSPADGMAFEATADIWDTNHTAHVIVDCLLPTGIIVQLNVRKDIALADLKDVLWAEYPKYPLHHLIEAKDAYIFHCINEKAEKVDLPDENQLLCEVRPFQPILKVIKLKEKISDRIQMMKLGSLIGKGLKEISTSSSEVTDFRTKMKKLCENIGKERDLKMSQSWLDRVNYLYPPVVVSDADYADENEEIRCLRIMVKFHDTRLIGVNSKAIYIPANAKPSEAIGHVLDKLNTNTKLMRNEFLLRVAGRNEFLLGDYTLAQYKYIRGMMMKGLDPVLQLVHKDSVMALLSPTNCAPEVPPRINRPTKPPKPQPKFKRTTAYDKKIQKTSWEMQGNYQLVINKVTNISCEERAKVHLRVGLYHGGETLCAIVITPPVEVVDGCAVFNHKVQFDILLQNVPRMARVCFSLLRSDDRKWNSNTYNSKKGRQKKQDILSWVNIPVYDYRGILRTDQSILFMWSVTNEDVLSEDLVNPIGTVECNPKSNDAIALQFTFHTFQSQTNSYISYPPLETVLRLGGNLCKLPNMEQCRSENIVSHIQEQLLTKKLPTLNPLMSDQLTNIIDRDPLTPIELQDQEKLWGMRYECCYDFPHSLPKLLASVPWNKHTDVAQILAIIQGWPPLSPTQALELLDFRYADDTVRRYAVKCLERFNDTDLSQYLLQLVQVLKYENYLDCDLVQFLLRRAVNNQRVGHYLFWLLRSEMQVPSVSVRFGLILESYFEGSNGHMTGLLKQIDALNKLYVVSKQLHHEQFKEFSKTKTKAIKMMKEHLERNMLVGSFSLMDNVLEPALHVKDLMLEECWVFNSKMRPLKLVWENNTEFGAKVQVIYKNGDDLRQDMIILQIMNIMSNIWQEAGLDLRLNPYGCLSTGAKEGVIELVPDAQTIANIQLTDFDNKNPAVRKTKGPLASILLNKSCLLEWLAIHKTQSWDKIIEEFKSSCASCCVASYVLGIGDRHNDNIMLTSNGQLFHIDFGHVLGNFKSKFGVNRERVPFVLTAEMLHVLKKDKDQDVFKEFRELCDDAYLALRRNSNFLITLFLMMTNTGIPEISKPEDVEYLKKTLVPELTEKQALAHFNKKFNEVLSSSWKTSINFLMHNLKKVRT